MLMQNANMDIVMININIFFKNFNLFIYILLHFLKYISNLTYGCTCILVFVVVVGLCLYRLPV